MNIELEIRCSYFNDFYYNVILLITKVIYFVSQFKMEHAKIFHSSIDYMYFDSNFIFSTFAMIAQC